MIIRIVKMMFRSEEEETFLSLFDARKQQIRHFDGCHHLELWKDTNGEATYFTYSIWKSEKHLDHYRLSELFKDTWARTKALFRDKPQAWSTEQITNVL